MNETETFLRALVEPGTCVRLSALPIEGRGQLSGRLMPTENIESMLGWAEVYSEDPACKGCYIAINPVGPDRRPLRRKFMLVDVDADGPDQTDAALDLGTEIRTQLQAEGWPEPISVATGGGVQMLYQIDEPLRDHGFVERMLDSLARRFRRPGAKVDRSVHDAARICRLPGTLNKKPCYPTPRPCKLIHMPAQLQTVPFSLRESLARPLSAEESQVVNLPETPVPVRYREYVVNRARDWMRERRPAIEGQGGRPHTWNTLLVLARGFCLPGSVARPLVEDWNEKNVPPWEIDDLASMWRDAQHAHMEWGCKITRPCIREAMGLPEKPITRPRAPRRLPV
jgi:hypothetical protein